GAVVGTISTAIWLPLRFWKSSSRCDWAATSLAESVPVVSTTRPTSGGTATSANAAGAQHRNSASTKTLAREIADTARTPDYFAGAAGAGVGLTLKSTLGAVEISFSFATWKFGF